ncbi:glycoside hydrolase family 2 protein [Chitinophaga sp. LS1]|uniref:glycoside hydrolase family 2 protein n=1 Tax=Chitinophaga sp. LS1 TaxID=3051176 RepID=UPI002AAB7B93|nr:sugar-binding domain-containing protein [Chitinophaga sp. LS1]WPV67800.1 glycoside hydrolase family 2 TIM barrel-domain containing protein [Chitinophaga sp. LS1]
MKRMCKAFAIGAILCVLIVSGYAQGGNEWKMQPVSIKTRWAKDVNPANVLPAYPRPQMVRNQWENLNGLWQYAITDKAAERPTQYQGQILVPFPIESALSGLKKPLLPTQRLWYKRNIARPNLKKWERVLLHFGAVDWQATVYVNGKEVGGHTGGYQEFAIDITDALKAGNNELVVGVLDPTDQGPNPHGKQVLQPKNILYTASSGIWQTVWMETVPATYIDNLYMTPDVDNQELSLKVNVDGNSKDYQVEAVASNGSIIKGKPGQDLKLPVNNARLWSPDDPYLYHLNVRLLHKGKMVDSVGSYFGMRKIEVKKDEQGVERLFLNNKYTYHLGVLDQGFWPEGLYTAPTDSALQFDIMAIRNMGFNTIRKHIKIEPARWYYHADRMGVLVWQDMVTCANGNADAHAEFEKENKENIAQLHNYPSIVIWVLFNEGWARYDQQRLTEWLKRADPGRVVDGHTGENYDRKSPDDPGKKWISSDLTDIHDYPGPGIAPYLIGKARVLGEWGGVRVPTPNHQWNGAEGWGYIQVQGAEFMKKYQFMMKHLKIFEEEGLSGSIYTEPFDVETEENGLMTYDREIIKIPAEKLREIHTMLVPNASQYAAAPGQFKAQIGDTIDHEREYAINLEAYNKGNRDANFLRNLAETASKMKDFTNAGKIGNDYIRQLKEPYQKDDIAFIDAFTTHITDPGFAIIKKHPEKIDAVLGAKSALDKLQGIIYIDEIKPQMDANTDWEKIEKTIVSKYGATGEEIVWKARTINYLDKKDYEKFANSAIPYIDKYGDHVMFFELNNFAWEVFQHLEDTNALKAALSWSKRTLQEGEAITFMDTYANLLYKLGKKDEAISVEEKAVNMAAKGDKPSFQANLDKMRKGESTWE